MIITSLANEKFRKYLKLKEKKYRDFYEEFIVEGEHVVLEAYKNGLIKELIVLENETPIIDFFNTVYVSESIMNHITSLTTPPKVCALCYKKRESELLKNKILLLDNIQDPGNLGTIIRSAVAFNIDTIVLSNNSVDLYNQKVIRATQGMLFHINIIRRDLFDIIKILKENNIPLYTTDVTGGTDISKLTIENKDSFGLVLGSEGQGVSEEIAKSCDQKIYIPINDKVESLNVAVAASIILYELGRK